MLILLFVCACLVYVFRVVRVVSFRCVCPCVSMLCLLFACLGLLCFVYLLLFSCVIVDVCVCLSFAHHVLVFLSCLISFVCVCCLCSYVVCFVLSVYLFW